MKIGLVGCGKMGAALLRGWLACAGDLAPSGRGGPVSFCVLEPQGIAPDLAERTEPGRVAVFTAPEAFSAAIADADILVLAVKPQVMDAVCAGLRAAVRADLPVLSIAAGQGIAAFKRRFAAGQPVIRAMPNTPAAIGRGMTVAVASPEVSPLARDDADRLLRVCGRVEWVADEGLMDAVTALSGSGPAYIFLLIEILTEAGVAVGLEAGLAAVLARETVIGAAALAEAEGQTGPEVLRRAVTSPGGTTEAALAVLMDGRLQALFDAALGAARDRGRALGAPALRG